MFFFIFRGDNINNNFQEGRLEPNLPGVLGGWREDLQGKRREQTREKKRDIFVKTTHGDVQGFQVYLFDNPSPDYHYRPGADFIEREQGITSVFLGIPYAKPPVNEGRFKVRSFRLESYFVYGSSFILATKIAK